MQIKFISPLRNLQFEINANIEGLKISTDKSGLDEFLDLAFIGEIGLLSFRVIEYNQFIYFNGDSKSLNFLKKSLTDKNSIQNSISSSIINIINGLWFIKDNSVYTFQTFFYYPEENLTSVNFSPVKITNALGQIEPVIFNTNEIKMYLEILPKIFDFYSHLTNITDFPDKTKELISQPYSFNRLGRANIFLFTARTEKSLPSRITAFIALLESLFTNGNSELTHQVSERVAFFIGGESSKKLDTYNKVKSAYNVRSRYMHGDNINHSLAKLQEISKEIDEVARQVFFKIINGETNVFLLNTNSESDKKKFETYFYNLIFS